ENKSTNSDFGEKLQERLQLAFRNWLIPPSILALIVFAVINDLISTFSGELFVDESWMLAPLVFPLLIIVSVALTLTSIALLFILVYDYIPCKAGYVRAVVFASFLFLIFLFGPGTDDRLIASLPTILVGRVIYYLSVPLLLGIYFDINRSMQEENQRRAAT